MPWAVRDDPHLPKGHSSRFWAFLGYPLSLTQVSPFPSSPQTFNSQLGKLASLSGVCPGIRGLLAPEGIYTAGNCILPESRRCLSSLWILAICVCVCARTQVSSRKDQCMLFLEVPSC